MPKTGKINLTGAKALYDIQDIQLVSKAWYSGGWVNLPSASAYLRMQIRAYSGAPVVAKIDQITY